MTRATIRLMASNLVSIVIISSYFYFYLLDFYLSYFFCAKFSVATQLFISMADVVCHVIPVHEIDGQTTDEETSPHFFPFPFDVIGDWPIPCCSCIGMVGYQCCWDVFGDVLVQQGMDYCRQTDDTPSQVRRLIQDYYLYLVYGEEAIELEKMAPTCIQENVLRLFPDDEMNPLIFVDLRMNEMVVGVEIISDDESST